MGPMPLARLHRALSRLARLLVLRMRPRPVRGVARTIDDAPLTARDRRRLRRLGFVPGILGGADDPPRGEQNNDAERQQQEHEQDGTETAPSDAHDTGEQTLDREQTFDRDYVARLRKESARYRERAIRAERQLEQGQADAAQLEAVTQRVRELEAELWRSRAAVQHNIPADLVDLLGDGSEDEVMSRAERLARRLAEQARRAVPTPERGARRVDPPSLDAQIAEAERRGDWARAGELKLQKLATQQQT